MLHTLSVSLIFCGFLAAGLVNAIGAAGAKAAFARWGYPAGWHIWTGGLEMVCAALIVLPVSRTLGLALGAAILAAAALTVLRWRDFAHLAPLSAFAALLALAGATA